MSRRARLISLEIHLSNGIVYKIGSSVYDRKYQFLLLFSSISYESCELQQTSLRTFIDYVDKPSLGSLAMDLEIDLLRFSDYVSSVSEVSVD